MTIFHVGGKFLLYFDIKLENKSLSYRRYEEAYTRLSLVEMFMDMEAFRSRSRAWIQGLWLKGFKGAHNAAFGLAVE